MTDVENLKRAIRHYRDTESVLAMARNDLRLSVRHVIKRKTANKGSGVVLAAKLNIPIQQLSNLKHGYGVPSADWAEKLVRVCERNGI